MSFSNAVTHDTEKSGQSFFQTEYDVAWCMKNKSDHLAFVLNHVNNI